jgi:vanillate/4-hydroxybenzoate decarboxylase subunit D
MSNFSFPRPSKAAPVQQRDPVAGAEALMRYPVLSEGDWFIAVKCQECLHSQSREKWTRLGYVTLLTDSLA